MYLEPEVVAGAHGKVGEVVGRGRAARQVDVRGEGVPIPCRLDARGRPVAFMWFQTFKQQRVGQVGENESQSCCLLWVQTFEWLRLVS